MSLDKFKPGTSDLEKNTATIDHLKKIIGEESLLKLVNSVDNLTAGSYQKIHNSGDSQEDQKPIVVNLTRENVSDILNEMPTNKDLGKGSLYNASLCEAAFALLYDSSYYYNLEHGIPSDDLKLPQESIEKTIAMLNDVLIDINPVYVPIENKVYVSEKYKRKLSMKYFEVDDLTRYQFDRITLENYTNHNKHFGIQRPQMLASRKMYAQEIRDEQEVLARTIYHEGTYMDESQVFRDGERIAGILLKIENVYKLKSPETVIVRLPAENHWHRPYAVENISTIVIDWENIQEQEQILAHEATHSLLSVIYGHSKSVILSEGAAEYVRYNFHPGEKERYIRYCILDSMLNFKSLKKPEDIRFSTEGIDPKEEKWYELGFLFTDYFVETYGWDKFLTLYGQVSGRKMKYNMYNGDPIGLDSTSEHDLIEIGLKTPAVDIDFETFRSGFFGYLTEKYKKYSSKKEKIKSILRDIF